MIPASASRCSSHWTAPLAYSRGTHDLPHIVRPLCWLQRFDQGFIYVQLITDFP